MSSWVLEAIEDQLLKMKETRRNLIDNLSIVWKTFENFSEESGLEASGRCH